MSTIKIHPQPIKDNEGNEVGVFLTTPDFNKLLEEIEDLEDIKAYDEAKMNDKEEAIPFEQAMEEIKKKEQNMNYEVEIKRKAQKKLAKISSPFSEVIVTKILALKTNPQPPGCKKLTERDAWRIRAGNYRIIYEIYDDVLRITVIEIDHRRQVDRS